MFYLQLVVFQQNEGQAKQACTHASGSCETGRYMLEQGDAQTCDIETAARADACIDLMLSFHKQQRLPQLWCQQSDTALSDCFNVYINCFDAACRCNLSSTLQMLDHGQPTESMS